MIVRCSTNKPAEIADEELRRLVHENVHLDQLDIVVGAEYVVFGIVFWSGVPYYYVLEADSDDYPVPVCAAFFETVCSRFPDSWSLVWNWSGKITEILPSEWAADGSFYEKLIDGDASASERFGIIRKKIEDEVRAKWEFAND
ncbi:MAG: hypothetical protein IPN69_18800 [Acidobacteria bacterium]|nr:hypothetical protein [Acidobacteriota bacterium]